MFLKILLGIFRLCVRDHLNICTLFVIVFHSSVLLTKILSVELHIFQVHVNTITYFEYFAGRQLHSWHILQVDNYIFGIFYRYTITSVCDGTQIFKQYRYFFRYQIFLVPIWSCIFNGFQWLLGYGPLVKWCDGFDGSLWSKWKQ